MQPALRTIRHPCMEVFMSPSERPVTAGLPHLEHLRKQAKDLLRAYRRQESPAFDRLRAALPAARGFP